MNSNQISDPKDTAGVTSFIQNNSTHTRSLSGVSKLKDEEFADIRSYKSEISDFINISMVKPDQTITRKDSNNFNPKVNFSFLYKISIDRILISMQPKILES